MSVLWIDVCVSGFPMGGLPSLILLFTSIFLLNLEGLYGEVETEGHHVAAIAVAATLDGRLHALDAGTGAPLWSVDMVPSGLVTSSLDNTHVMDFQDGYVRIIPSLSGDIFKWNGHRLEQYPTNADVLLTNSAKLAENTIASGAINVHTLAVQVMTGSIAYRCQGSEPCKHENDDVTAPSGGGGYRRATGDLLVVRATQRTVRAIDQLSGSEKWNFSVADVELSYSMGERSGGLIDFHNPMPPVDPLFASAASSIEYHCDDSHSLLLKVMTPEGLVFGVDPDTGNQIWQHKFDAPLAHLWRYSCNSVVRMELSDHSVVPDLQSWKHVNSRLKAPSLYLGNYGSTWYVQVFSQVKTLYAPLYFDPVPQFKQSLWKPLLATSPSRTPYLNHQRNTQVLIDYDHESYTTALQPINYPFDDGYSIAEYKGDEYGAFGFYFGTDDSYERDDHQKLLPEWHSTPEPPAEIFYPYDQIVAFLPVSLKFYWKQILSIGIVIGLGINFIFYIVQNVLRKKCAPSNENSESNDNVERETSVETRMSTSASGFKDNFKNFQKLGKGGFGQVYVAQHKLDLQSYAIKRIELPRKAENADKMRREVRALSKLNHSGIVRYYNSWEETIETTVVQDIFSERTDPTSFEGLMSPSELSSNVDISSQIHPRVTFNSGPEGDASSRQVLDVALDESTDGLIVFKASTSGADDKKRDANANNIDHISFSQTSKVTQTESEAVSSAPTLKTYLFIQMELCRPNTLKDWLMEELERERDISLHIFHQIIQAVSYLHGEGQFHRDLKPSNIFFAESDGSVKIGDFGLVTSFENQEEGATLQSSNSYSDASLSRSTSTSTNALSKHTSKVGTKIYMSPEQREGKPYDSKVDIFALGIILFELLQPFHTETERIFSLKAIRSHDFPAESEGLFQTGDLDLVAQMLAHEPGERPNIEELCKHQITSSYVAPDPAARLKTLSTSRTNSSRIDTSSS